MIQRIKHTFKTSSVVNKAIFAVSAVSLLGFLGATSVGAATRLSQVSGQPTDPNQCKNGGWQNFSDPSFKNQGQCVSFVVSNRDHGYTNSVTNDNDVSVSNSNDQHVSSGKADEHGNNSGGSGNSGDASSSNASSTDVTTSNGQ